MKLYLVQHGDAVPKDQDPERPLSEGGSADVENVARFLKNAGVEVARVLHSGKLRAKQTADIFARELTHDVKPEQFDGIAPNDDPKNLMEPAFTWTEDTLVAGHLPFMERAVSLFTTNAVDRNIASYRPGSVVCLERIDGSWAISWMLRPELFG